MFRKTILAISALGALSIAALAPTSASAGWHGGHSFHGGGLRIYVGGYNTYRSYDSCFRQRLFYTLEDGFAESQFQQGRGQGHGRTPSLWDVDYLDSERPPSIKLAQQMKKEGDSPRRAVQRIGSQRASSQSIVRMQ